MDGTFPKVSLLFTEARSLHSNIMGCDYQISIWFPPDYPQPNVRYPVIYVTDPELHNGFLSCMFLGFMLEKLMPMCLLVGVGRQGVSTLDQWNTARNIDMVPPEDTAYPQARGAEYLDFFRKELIPFVESTYPVDPADRCLVGFSRGGEFTLYALMKDPELFQRYFVGSGVWDRISPLFLDLEEKLAEQRKSLPARVFFTVGSKESTFLPYVCQMAEALKRRNYAGLWVDTLIVEGESHLTSGPQAWSVGIRALYKKL
jgi:uncharacterized protein